MTRISHIMQTECFSCYFFILYYNDLLAVIEVFFFFQAEDGIRDGHVTEVQTCALPIYPRDEVPHRAARVAHARRHLRILLAAGEIACHAAEDAAVAARLERLIDHAAHVRLHAGVLGGQGEAGLAAAHYDRPLERLLELAPDHALGLGRGHLAHIDARDRHALRDQVIASAVVRERCDRAPDQDQKEDGHEDEPSVPHGGIPGQGSYGCGRWGRLGAGLRGLDP